MSFVSFGEKVRELVVWGVLVLCGAGTISCITEDYGIAGGDHYLEHRDGILVGCDFVGDTDVSQIGYLYQQVDCVSAEPIEGVQPVGGEPVPLSRATIPGGIEDLEESLDAESRHVFADLLILPEEAGCYTVTTFPLKEDRSPSEDCEPARSSVVEYVAGQLIETLVINNCSSEDLDGVDVIDALNHEPEILQFWIEQPSPVCIEEREQLCVVTRDVDNDPLEIIWAISPEENLVNGPTVISDSRDDASGERTQCVEIEVSTEQSYELDIAVYDLMRDRDGTWVHIEDWLNENQLPVDGDEPQEYESRAELSHFFYAEDCVPCRCPEGFEASEDASVCERTLRESAVRRGTSYAICGGSDNPGYGDLGAKYPDGTYETNSFWGDANPFAPYNGRLNSAGIWACGDFFRPIGSPHNEWIGVTMCHTEDEARHYIAGLGASSGVRLEVSGKTEFVIEPHDPEAGNAWHLVPFQVPAGPHAIEATGYNTSGQGAYAFEIYGPFTAEEIANSDAMEIALRPVVDRGENLVFSTGSLVGGWFPTYSFYVGENSGWSCEDETWTVDSCGDPNQPDCVKYEQQECL